MYFESLVVDAEGKTYVVLSREKEGSSWMKRIYVHGKLEGNKRKMHRHVRSSGLSGNKKRI